VNRSESSGTARATSRCQDLAQYEIVGIPPEIEVAPEEDALERVLEVIRSGR